MPETSKAPFAIQAAQPLGRAIGAGLFAAITPFRRKGDVLQGDCWVTPWFSQSRRCKNDGQ
ncbi:hypothetical protein NWE46_22315 [Escherichia coli]|nr:hypothetical protein [Escherichia coli]